MSEVLATVIPDALIRWVVAPLLWVLFVVAVTALLRKVCGSEPKEPFAKEMPLNRKEKR